MAALLALAACTREPVRWLGDAATLRGPGGGEYTLMIRGSVSRAAAVARTVPIPSAGLPSLGANACPQSVRWARAGALDVAVAWWQVRPDSSVVLRLARSRDDGAHWDTLPPADARDRGVRGCTRAAPAVALDPLSGYTHLAYYLEPADGAGVFYEHLMDLPASGGRDTISMFHAPVGIVYGQGPVETSVAGHGDTVVVAYQDPNAPVPHIALALSVTAGHAFPERMEVSGVGIAASEPVVAIEDDLVAVAWQAEAPALSAEGSTGTVGRRVVRVGVIQ